MLAGTATAAQAGSTTQVCKASQLRANRLDSSGAAGTIVFSVTLRNTGAACALKGYAGLRLTKRTGSLPTRVVHDDFGPLDQQARTILLAHNGQATILVAYSDVPTGSARCPQSTGLLIRPPGQNRWLQVAVHATACNRGTLRESPVLAGVHRSP